MGVLPDGGSIADTGGGCSGSSPNSFTKAISVESSPLFLKRLLYKAVLNHTYSLIFAHQVTLWSNKRLNITAYMIKIICRNNNKSTKSTKKYQAKHKAFLNKILKSLRCTYGRRHFPKSYKLLVCECYETALFYRYFPIFFRHLMKSCFLDRLDINTSTNLKQKIYGKNGKIQFALHIQI